MDKYKILGSINIFLGITLAIVVVVFAVGIIPRLIALYSELAINTTINLHLAYVGLVVLFITAIINLFLSYKLIWGSASEKEKYFVPGIIWAIASLVLPGIIIVPTIIKPLYSLISSFGLQRIDTTY